jgi:membrane-bound acyltransferase YfiQ involved in biofilm formation
VNYPEWNKILWYVVLAVAFGLEFLGIFAPGKATLTRLICAAIPAWLRAMILGWLFYHFLLQNPS